MIIWIENLVTQSIPWSLFMVLIISFLESLALVGLILPGAILMGSLGAMIGSNQINLYPSWIAGSIGCLLGDWLSYYLGWKFKRPLSECSFLKRYSNILKKTKYALYQYRMCTITLGRFIGHTRPLIPLIAGMTGLPAKKFVFPNIIACLLWPPLYFMPGILAGVMIEIPHNDQVGYLKWIFFFIVILFFLGIWLCWRWKNFNNQNDFLSNFLTLKKLRLFSPLVLTMSILSFSILQFHPVMKLFRQLLIKIFLIK